MTTLLHLEDFTPEQIETVKAFALAVKSKSKKDIECRHIDGSWGDAVINDEMDILYDYRIKPQPKLIPFDFNDADKLRDKWIESHDFMETGGQLQIIGITSSGVLTITREIRFPDLLSNFTFLDGSPCGKKEL